MFSSGYFGIGDIDAGCMCERPDTRGDIDLGGLEIGNTQ
jgi:hypothetical protein